MHDRDVYIYGLTDPDTHEVRYIGQSSRPRMRLNYHHTASPRRTNPLGQWLSELAERGLRAGLVVLEKTTAHKAHEAERAWIAFYLERGIELRNVQRRPIRKSPRIAEMTARGAMTPEEVWKFRADRGWTQQQLAEWLDVDQTTVSRWESGQSSMSRVVRLALEAIARTEQANTLAETGRAPVPRPVALAVAAAPEEPEGGE